MSKNESPYDMPSEIKEGLEELKLNRYPEEYSSSLKQKISSFTGINPDRIAVGNGSDEIMDCLTQIFTGDYIVTCPPTFGMYGKCAELKGLKNCKIPLKQDFSLNTSKIVEKADDAAIIFLCSPNSPTGNTLDRSEIVKVLETGKPVVVDEAYQEFAESSIIDLVPDYDNLIVLRTFSKALGAAGVRLGYAISSSEIIENLTKVLGPYNINKMSSLIGQKILENYDYIQENVREIKSERRRVINNFPDLSYPSEANFVLMDVDASGFLAEKGISVRSFGSDLSGKMRVTIGKPKENSRLIKALNEFLEQKEGKGETQ